MDSKLEGREGEWDAYYQAHLMICGILKWITHALLNKYCFVYAGFSTWETFEKGQFCLETVNSRPYWFVWALYVLHTCGSKTCACASRFIW